MVDTPRADFTGQFSSSAYQIGSRFRAHHQPVVSNLVGKGIDSLIQTAIVGSQQIKEIRENSPAEREYWIKQQRLVDESFAQNGKLNQANPEAFRAQAMKDKAKMMREIPTDKQEKFSLMFEDRMSGFNQAIVQNRIKLDFGRQLETFMQEGDSLRTQAFNAKANGDEAGYQAGLAKWAENEEYMYSHGFISIEKKISRLKDFTDTALVQQHLGQAKKLFGDTGKLNTLLENIDKTKDYSPEQKKSIRNNIISEYGTWKALNSVASQEINDHADFGIKAYSMGIDPQDFDFDETMAELKRLGQVEKAKQLSQAHNVRQEMISFAKLAPEQMTAELKELKKTASNEQDLARIKALESLTETAVKEIDGDPLGFALRHNVVADAGLNLNDPASLKLRRNNAAFLKEKYKLRDTPLITKAEADTLSESLKRLPADQQVAVLGNIYGAFDKDSGSIFKAIAPKNPEFAHAASAFEHDPAIAQRILEGSEIVKAQPEYTPSNNRDFDDAFYKKIDPSTFGEASPEWLAGLKNAVKANLASQNRNSGVTDRTLNSGNFDQAFKEVVGEVVSLEQDGSGYLYDDTFKAAAPIGVSAEDFSNWWLGLKDKDLGDAYTMSGIIVDGKTAVSSGTLGYIDNGKYRLRVKGELVYKDGKPLVLSYGE